MYFSEFASRIVWPVGRVCITVMHTYVLGLFFKHCVEPPSIIALGCIPWGSFGLSTVLAMLQVFHLVMQPQCGAVKIMQRY